MKVRTVHYRGATKDIYVRRTPRGWVCEAFQRVGDRYAFLASRSYFYGDDAEARATRYADSYFDDESGPAAVIESLRDNERSEG